MCIYYINSIFVGFLWFCNDHEGKTSVIQKKMNKLIYSIGSFLHERVQRSHVMSYYWSQK